jgi:hypothetical protein
MYIARVKVRAKDLGISEELLGTHWGTHQALEENVKNSLRT